MDDFDVLSFISPLTHTFLALAEVPVVTFSYEANLVEKEAPAVEESDHDWDAPIHIFDLPALSSKPPGQVLYIILKLMRADTPTNFGTGTIEEKTISERLLERQITLSEIEEVIPWLSENSTLSSIAKIANLSNNATEINPYFTSIVASTLSWIDDEQLKEKIWKESSLRLSENCGRTAQPEFTRKIVLSGVPPINLHEPSLTSDNLGLKTWGSSLMLSQRLINDPSAIVEPVLELGSGTGLVGITCLLLGFKDITLTDLPDIVPNLAKNIELNNLPASNQVKVLDWSNSTSFELSNKGRLFNTIILSDPLYSSKHPLWIVDMLTKFLSPTGRVLLQIPIRINFAKERAMLWKLMLEKFTETASISEDGYDDFGEQKFIFKTFNYSSSSNI